MPELLGNSTSTRGNGKDPGPNVPWKLALSVPVAAQYLERYIYNFNQFQQLSWIQFNIQFNNFLNDSYRLKLK